MLWVRPWVKRGAHNECSHLAPSRASNKDVADVVRHHQTEQSAIAFAELPGVEAYGYFGGPSRRRPMTSSSLDQSLSLRQIRMASASYAESPPVGFP